MAFGRRPEARVVILWLTNPTGHSDYYKLRRQLTRELLVARTSWLCSGWAKRSSVRISHEAATRRLRYYVRLVGVPKLIASPSDVR
jgi:hypothetical protein